MAGRLSRAWLSGALVLTLVATAVGAGSSATFADAPSPATPPGLRANPIKHVIEIMMENHSFDNLFGSFPGANGIPAGTKLLNPNAYYDSAPAVSPVWATPNEGDVQGAINNSAVGEQMAMDYQPRRGYLMDHYTVFPQDGMSAITEFGPAFDPNEQYLASHFELLDHNFQPVIAPTQPNVMTALNGTDHGWVYNNLEPGSTQPWNSIFDELAAHGRTWKIYYALPNAILNGTIWDQIIPPGQSQDLTTADQFFSDIASGNLPEFSLIRPGVGYTTEPREDIGEGDAWVGQLVNAVARSPYWKSSVIFLTYDESGGFWDHVAPSSASGYGARTPTVIISPYARRGVFHQETTNVSVLSFMQHLWGMAPLTPLNARQNDLMAAFDFHQQPLPAPVVPVAPADTIGFHGSSDLSDVGVTSPGRTLTINLEAETGGLTLDAGVSGSVQLTVTPPPGVAVPASFPGTVVMTGGRGTFQAKFPSAGYYRIKASGPDGAVGWVTVDVSVNPNTAP